MRTNKVSLKPSLKWQQMKAVYLNFKPSDCPSLDYSEEAEIEMFLHESTGSAISQSNGFYWCKRNLDVTLAMWYEDIVKGELIKFELLADKRFPQKWLESWLDKVIIDAIQQLEVVLESKQIPELYPYEIFREVS